MMQPVRPITFAHRGARLDEPVNTLPAFRRALELGASGLESDVRLSAAGRPVLVHDPVVRRGLRRVGVARSTATRLAELDVPALDQLYETEGTAFELSLDAQDPAAAGPVIALAARRDALDRLWLC